MGNNLQVDKRTFCDGFKADFFVSLLVTRAKSVEINNVVWKPSW